MVASIPPPGNEENKLPNSNSKRISKSENILEGITQLAARICHVPIVIITLLDDDGYSFNKAEADANVPDRYRSLCQLALQKEDIFEVEDTLRHPVFCYSPLVLEPPMIRFYAGVPLIDAQGQKLGSFCILDQKPGKLNEDQRNTLKLLADLVVQSFECNKTKQLLEDAKREADEEAIVKSDFFSMMSYEIRTPLHALMGSAYLLQDTPLTDLQREYFKILQTTADKLKGVLNYILDFSRIETGEFFIEEIEFNLIELLLEIRKKFEPLARKKGIVMKLMMDEQMPRKVMGDPCRLMQVLNNLLDNAIKYTVQGTVSMEVSVENKNAHKIILKFSVIDTGIGIAEEKHKTLFKRVAQANISIAHKYENEISGLPFTQQLLNKQNSSIDLVSEVGKGSRFSFLLTFKRAARETQEMMPARKTFEPFLGEHILIAEDDEVNGLIARRLLEKWNLQVDVAENGLRAVEMVLEKDYALVLMDLQMPERNGYEATIEIRKSGGRHASLPIIALTASELISVYKDVLNAGMSDFISKPFNPADLHKKLERHLYTDV